MKTRICCLLAFFITHSPLWADIDITDLYLQNAGFDNSEHYDYTATESGNVAQEILPIYGWNKDIGVDYTVTGIYEYGTSKTFNTSGKVPSAGYNNSKGGCLALSTGWEESLKYYQTITLPAGNYKLQSAFYNGSNSANGSSLLGWIPTDSNNESIQSTISSFNQNSWTLDELTFSLTTSTEGRIQIGFKGASGGSANSAKVIVDYVKLILVGDNNTLISTIKSQLNTTLSSANSLYKNGTGRNASELKSAIDQAQNLYDSSVASYSEVFLSNKELQHQIILYQWANSTLSNPSDMTNYITNPSFENQFNGWKQEGFQTQSNTSFSLKSGNNYIEKWVASGNTIGTNYVVQTLSNELPLGIYILKIAAQNKQSGQFGQTGAWLVAENDSIEVSETKEYTMQFTHIENTLSIGFFTYQATGNWVALDNFRLYYSAATTDDYKSELQHRINVATEMLTQTMNEKHRSSIQQAIQQANQWISSPDETQLPAIAELLRKVIQNAQMSVNAFRHFSEEINNAQSIYNAQLSESQNLYNAIQQAVEDVQNEALSIDEIDQKIKQLQNSAFAFQIANGSGDVPQIKTDPRHVTGATKAFGRASFTDNNLLEKGFCWSTHTEPTVLDNRSSLSYNNNGDIYVMEDLQPSTIYYIRPYAISTTYAVGYGNSIKICTLPKGTITWSYNNGGSDDENTRINAAILDAVTIWNNLTSIQGLNLSVSYGASTPTADCSYGGSMRVGPNASYQKTGTIQHEMAHAAGVGTTETWYNSAIYRQETTKGFWLGERTDQVVQFLENDTLSQLKGDNTHFWPYGINGAHEDDGTRILYYANALIVQSLGEDFLPPVRNAFASAAYTFTQDDDEYYYLLPEACIQNNSIQFLQQNTSGTLQLASSNWKNILSDHSFAWTIRFNPQTQHYEFKNVSTQQSLYEINAQVSSTDETNYSIQLLGARQKMALQNFYLKSYWVVFPDGSNHPKTLSAPNFALSLQSFDHQNSAAQQRWILLSSKEVRSLSGESSTVSEYDSSISTIIYGGKSSLYFETIDNGDWIIIRDLNGRCVDQFYMQAHLTITKPMKPGIYLINGQKIVVFP